MHCILFELNAFLPYYDCTISLLQVGLLVKKVRDLTVLLLLFTLRRILPVLGVLRPLPFPAFVLSLAV